MFTFLRDCRANLKVEVGDARLTLEQAPANSIDLLVLDAFSSDSIPVHLLTKEAFDMYLRKLRPGGVIAVHISNRYLDLEPILAKEASSLALVSRSNDDTESDNHTGKAASHWIIMARSLSDLSPLDRSIDWNGLLVSDSTPLWTDDYSNLLGAFKKEF